MNTNPNCNTQTCDNCSADRFPSWVPEWLRPSNGEKNP